MIDSLSLDAVYQRFREVFGGEPHDHPLYQQMETDFKKGRAIPSLLNDLQEAQANREANRR